MTEPTKSRPFGELLVNVDRPPLRFGQQITFGVRGEDQRIWVATVLDRQLLWTPCDPSVQVEPTLYLDDKELAVLRRELNHTHVRDEEDAVREHLKDAIAVRDRHLKMLEQEWMVRTDTGTRAT